MNTPQEIASANLGKNLHKIVKVALMNYRKQSQFYRKCNSPNAHVARFVSHFYQGFLKEAKFASYTAKVYVPNRKPVTLIPTVKATFQVA